MIVLDVHICEQYFTLLTSKILEWYLPIHSVADDKKNILS